MNPMMPTRRTKIGRERIEMEPQAQSVDILPAREHGSAVTTERTRVADERRWC